MPAGKTELTILPEPENGDFDGSKSASRLRLPSTPADRARLRGLTTCAEIVVGAAVFFLVVPHFHGDIALFLILASLNLVAERMPISVYGESQVTVGFVFTLPIIALFGLPGAALVAPPEAVFRRAGHRPFDIGFLRSACRGVTVYCAAAGVYELLAPIDPARFEFSMVPASAAATAITFVLLGAFMTWNRALESGLTLSSVWANHRWVGLHYLAFGIVGFSFLSTYSMVGYWAMLAYITPVFMLRLSMKQYVDKTAENVEKLKSQNKALEIANVEISKISNELRVTYGATLEALVSALEARDQETKGHSVRVARYMLNIAEALGVKPGTDEYQDMQHGALLHDVGKIGVRDAILLKPGALTPDEWALMRKHPEIGYNILREVNFLQGAARIVLAHHERWDGAGYPFGLKSDEIPLGSRIFAVVDTFDTMTSDRVYRRALTPEDALQEILRCSGSQFDPFVVEAFLDIYEEWVLERQRLHAEPLIFKAAA